MSVNTEKVQDSILQAIDILTSKKLSEISFDETIICTILDDSDKKNGKYYVTDGSMKFLAHADTDKYRNNEQVRVQIPKGDYAKEKFIIGKYINENPNNPITYVSPLETVVEMESFKVSHGENNQYSISALDCDTFSRVGVWALDLDEENYINTLDGVHTTITLQADFKTLFHGYNFSSGQYGLVLGVKVAPNPKSVTADSIIRWECELNSKDMFGNPYSFITYTGHAQKFNFSTFGTIVGFDLILYQDGKFKDKTGKKLCENVDGVHQHNNVENILVKNIKIGIGSDILNISDNVLKLYSLDNTEYTGKSNDVNRTLEFTWYNKDEDNKYIGFSDGIADPTYDEIEYLKVTNAERRLIAEKGQINVPEDRTSLYLSANIKEFKPLINKVKDIISKNLYTELIEFEYQLKARILKDILNNKTETTNAPIDEYIESIVSDIEDDLNSCEEEYNRALSLGYSIWRGLDFKGSIEPPSENYGNSIYNLIFTNIIVYVDDRLNAIKEKIDDSDDDTYRNYDSIYKAYEYRINKVLNDIKKLLFVNEQNEIINNNLKTFFGLIVEGEYFDLNSLQTYYEKNAQGEYKHNQQWYKDNSYQETLSNEEYSNKYSIYWFRYEKDYEPLNELVNFGLGWKRIEELDNKGIPDGSSVNEYLLQKPTNYENRQQFKLDEYLLDEQFRIKLFYNHQAFDSEIIKFTNTDPAIRELILDQGKALVIEHGKDSRDKYNIYHSTTKHVFNSMDSAISRQVMCHYDGVAKSDEAMQKATVCWHIPDSDTHLETSDNELKNLGFAVIGNDSPYYLNGYKGYTKTITYNKALGENNEFKSGNIDTRMFQYKLKATHSQNWNRNDIQCRVYLCANPDDENAPVGSVGDTELAAARIFSFGEKFTNGTQYTLSISPSGDYDAVYKTLRQDLDLDVVLFDYEDKPVNFDVKEENSNNIYEMQVSINETKMIDTGEEAGDIVFSNEVINIPYDKYGIIKATISKNIEFDNQEANEMTKKIINLSTEFAVPMCFREDRYRLSGPLTIIYNNLGVLQNEEFYNDKYKLYLIDEQGQETEVQNLTWRIIFYCFKGESSGLSIEDSQSEKYQQLINDTANLVDGKLIPPNIYISNNPYYPIVIASDTSGEIWRQPIIITQNLYQSNLLNKWDGNLVVDEENNYILSAMVGAGIKDNDNRFSGVLMGDVGIKSEGATTDTSIVENGSVGLYGFHQGAQSFGFKVDGTAFLGKSGSGRILFDGNNGFIVSQNWFTGKDNEKHPQFNKDNPYPNGGIIGTNGKVEKNSNDGMLINLQDGHIDAYNFKLTSSNIFINSNPEEKKPYFQINGSDKPLIYMSNEQYYLQTNNYEENVTGIKYDLEAGTISSKNFNVYSNGNVSLTGVITAEAGGSIGGWQIADWGIYKTIEKTQDDGTKYNLTTGLQIPSNDSYVALTIGATNFDNWTSAPFYVTHEGALYAKKGEIGNIAIIDGALETATMSDIIKQESTFRATLNINSSGTTYTVANYGSNTAWYNKCFVVDNSKGNSEVKVKIGGCQEIYIMNPNINSNHNFPTFDSEYWECISHAIKFGSTTSVELTIPAGEKRNIICNHGNESGWVTLTGNYFKLDSVSGLTAINANITGIINATGGSFTGTVNTGYLSAWGGEIAGWKITSNGISNVSVWDEYSYGVELTPDFVNIHATGEEGSGTYRWPEIGFAVSQFQNRNTLSFAWSKIILGSHPTARIVIESPNKSQLSGKWSYADGSVNEEIATRGWVNSRAEIACLYVEDTTFTWSGGSATRTYISSQNGYGMVIGASGISGDLVGTWWCNGNNLSSSDLRVKNDINTISSNYQQFYDNLNPVSYKYNDGNSGRIHTGFIAQEIVSALEKANLTTQDFAAVCQRDHNIKDSEWGVRYGEFVALNTWQIQLANKKLKEQETQINELKQQLDELKSSFNIN